MKRVNVNFHETTYAALEGLAQRKGTSMAEILRDAIALEKWLQEVRDRGGKLLIHENGETRELVFR